MQTPNRTDSAYVLACRYCVPLKPTAEQVQGNIAERRMIAEYEPLCIPVRIDSSAYNFLDVFNLRTDLLKTPPQAEEGPVLVRRSIEGPSWNFYVLYVVNNCCGSFHEHLFRAIRTWHLTWIAEA